MLVLMWHSVYALKSRKMVKPFANGDPEFREEVSLAWGVITGR